MDAKMSSSDEVYVDEIEALRGEIKVMNENMERVIEALVNFKEDVTKDVMDNVGKKLGLRRDTTNINKWSDDNKLPLNESLLDTYSTLKYKGLVACNSGKKILLNKVYNHRNHRWAANSKDSIESVHSPINTRASHQRKVGQQLCSPYIAVERLEEKRQLKFDDDRKTAIYIWGEQRAPETQGEVEVDEQGEVIIGQWEYQTCKVNHYESKAATKPVFSSGDFVSGDSLNDNDAVSHSPADCRVYGVKAYKPVGRNPSHLKVHIDPNNHISYKVVTNPWGTETSELPDYVKNSILLPNDGFYYRV
ncbi:hypothetical protein M0R45_031073 [Rubus argutus]|uniref:Uncharacterized protein n=1 Tax=Rubus argutus TaxID=59490 RepID=A0AAW1WFB6_RUBAR